MKLFYLILISLYLNIIINIFSQSPDIYPGFPLLLDSNFQGLGFKTPLTADLDKDGNKEIIILSDVFKLSVVKSNGQNLPGFPKYYNDLIRAISCGDVDGNGYLDIVLRSDNSVFVLDKNGLMLNGFPKNITSPGKKFVSLYDLDNDGKLEIIANFINGLFVFEYNGQVRNGWPKTFDGTCNTYPALGDIDNDGYGEIILSTYDGSNGSLRIYRHNGENFSNNWPVLEDSSYISYYGGPTLYLKQSAIDTSYIIIASNREENQYYSSSRMTKYALDGDIIKRTYLQADSWISQVIIGKLDNNIYYGTGDNEDEIYLYNKQLQLVDNWPNRGIHYTDFANIIFGRVSSDNNKDIVSFFNAADMYFGYGITFGYKINGESQSWFPLRTYGLNVGHLFSDINNDGSTEYLYHSIQHNKTWLKIITIPGMPYTSENYPWPVFEHDRYRTNQYGFIPPDEPNGIEYISNKIPKTFELHQNYPNPFNASTIIKFEIKKQSDVKLIIYDILGRFIKELANGKLLPGSYRLSWNTAGLSSGVYFYELTSISGAEGEDRIYFKEIRKAVIVK